ncbi:MAG: hypothetical protein Q9183_003814 [Haloplaca sp. 2 TL-2023]
MVAGQLLYVVTSPQDVTDVYKNTRTLTFDEYAQDVMKSIGVSDDGITKLWSTPEKSDNRGGLHKALAHAGEDYYREQFLPGNRIDVLWPRVLGLIDSAMQWDQLPQTPGAISTDGVKTVSLLEWKSKVLLESVITAFFGPQLLQIDPQLLLHFAAYDEESWKLTYKYPRMMSKNMYHAKDQLVAAVETWLNLPRDKRPDGAWFIQKLETESSKLEMGIKDLAAMITSLAWVILSNAYKLSFWMMAYMIFDASLYAAIKAEVEPIVTAGTTKLETRIGECPRLIALFNEVLRLTTASASIRTVESDTPLGDKVLRKGGKVLLPFRQLHFNQDIFGSNTGGLEPERFLKNTKLHNSSSFRPFGGGSTYCPGRYVARWEVLTFVALALCRFGGISLASAETHMFPELDTKKPCLGIMTPIPGQDIRVMVRKKAT